jgi:hypothetical protein
MFEPPPRVGVELRDLLNAVDVAAVHVQEGFDEHVLAGTEPVLQRADGDADRPADVGEAGALDPALGDHAHDRVENLLTARFGRAAWAPARRACGVCGLGHWHEPSWSGGRT